jgi:DNA-binding transcriptional ArsR family regulator
VSERAGAAVVAGGVCGEVTTQECRASGYGRCVCGVHRRVSSGHLLTGDRKVTYFSAVVDDDRVFKALADPTRRLLLDLLFERDGRTLSDLESQVEMSRFGVMKHLKVLEEAGLVVTQKSGREKLHYLNAVPIRLIHDRWIDKYTERRVTALIDLKAELEQES